MLNICLLRLGAHLCNIRVTVVPNTLRSLHTIYCINR